MTPEQGGTAPQEIETLSAARILLCEFALACLL